MSRCTFRGVSLDGPEAFPCGAGRAVIYTGASPDKTPDANEDAAGVFAIDTERVVLAVADGLGGCPSGASASSLAIGALAACLTQAGPESLRSAIVDGFEAANERLLAEGVGSGTTLVVAEIRGMTVRLFHAGDSGAIVVGQRGKVRLETIPHSPVGYAVAAGVLAPAEAHHHEERHVLSNCVGSKDMRVEIGAPTRMSPCDTVLLASDGVLDNLRRAELIGAIRKGPLDAAVERIRRRVRRTMDGGDSRLPAHPDDVTVLAYRRRRGTAA